MATRNRLWLVAMLGAMMLFVSPALAQDILDEEPPESTGEETPPAVEQQEPPGDEPGAGTEDQEPPGEEPRNGEGMEALMEQMALMAQPGEFHAYLAPLEGRWRQELRWWMCPEAPPHESTGTCTYRWILDGRFLQEEATCDDPEQPFQGLGLLGYDNVAQQYALLWVDTMSTGPMVLYGTCDETRKVFTFENELLSPMTGETQIVRQLLRLQDENTHVLEMYVSTPELGEFKTMEIVHTRLEGLETDLIYTRVVVITEKTGSDGVPTDLVIISRDGYIDESRHLTRPQFEKLAAFLEGWHDLDDEYMSETTLASMVFHSVTYSGKTVRWLAHGTNVPERLLDFGRWLRAVTHE